MSVVVTSQFCMCVLSSACGVTTDCLHSLLMETCQQLCSWSAVGQVHIQGPSPQFCSFVEAMCDN